MFEAGKIDNTIQEMERLQISIFGISEMYQVYYSDNDDAKNLNRDAIVFAKCVAQSV